MNWQKPAAYLILILIVVTACNQPDFSRFASKPDPTATIQPLPSPSPSPELPAKDCLPNAEEGSLGFKCVPRDSNGNIGQLGGIIPDETDKLPSLDKRRRDDRKTKSLER